MINIINNNVIIAPVSTIFIYFKLVARGGFEPPTFGL